MIDKVKVAIIGAGNMAEEHIKAFLDISEINIVGIHSRTVEKSKKLALKYEIPNVFDSIPDMYNYTNANIVIIAVSELSTKEVCEKAFDFPWTCLVEKPAGYDLNDAEAIALKARNELRQVFVGLNRRQYSSTINVINDLSKSNQTRLIHVYDQQNPRDALALGRPEPVVKNWMYANSIHLIDYFKLFGRGEIISVIPIIKWEPNNPMFVLSKIIYSSGDIGIYESVWNAPGPWSVSITTQEKRWELKPLEKAAFQVYGTRHLEEIQLSDWDINFKPGFRMQAEEMLKAIQGIPHNLVNIDEALDSMRLVNKIYA